MLLTELNLKKSYDSDLDDILTDFYIPALSKSIKYKRLTGFFSSTALAVAARGISNFIQNNGIMELICCARLSKSDINAIKDALENPERLIEKNMLKSLEILENEFISDHVRALGWMVANNKLNIKIAIVINENGFPEDEKSVDKMGIFHQKVGILEDSEGNRISFSGSDNETAAGWMENIEEFKVFTNWNIIEKDYLNADLDRFNKFWEGTSKRTKVIDVPSAIKKELIRIAPDSIEDCDLEKWLRRDKKNMPKREIKLRDYQEQAITNWLTNDNKGIFEMATGTGKTFTALGCLRSLLKNQNKLITIIACPFDHLVKQWQNDLADFGLCLDTMVADSSNRGWKSQLADYILDIKNGIRDDLVVLTTHNTCSSTSFIERIKKFDGDIFLIVDEVHGIGAQKNRIALLEIYRFRLGLSATPKRWFDDEGTGEIIRYFGDVVFEFSLRDAISTVNPNTGETYLVPYEYRPYFAKLTEEEFDKYIDETNKIAKLYHRSKLRQEKEELINQLCFKRQKIIENAFNKYDLLLKILQELSEIKYCLIYCSPRQIDNVQDILNKKGIIQHKFTMNEGVKKETKYGGLSERSFLIREFGQGNYQALVAMKCLDEGVDIPPARTAIIMASTGNPRQYIQRRGRVLRRYPEKRKAIIYDILVIPGELSPNNDVSEIEKKILEKEIRRYKEFAYTAINTIDCLEKIKELEDKYKLIV